MPAISRGDHGAVQSCRHFAARPTERLAVRATVGSDGRLNDASRSIELSRTYGVKLSSPPPPSSWSMLVDSRSASTLR